jgi:hypothetical protein
MPISEHQKPLALPSSKDRTRAEWALIGSIGRRGCQNGVGGPKAPGFEIAGSYLARNPPPTVWDHDETAFQISREAIGAWVNILVSWNCCEGWWLRDDVNQAIFLQQLANHHELQPRPLTSLTFIKISADAPP